MDDYMFSAVMSDPANIKPLLEIILGKKIKKITFTESQKTEKDAYESKGIRLDLFVQDENNNIYNVEVQLTNKYNIPKRSRYYQSITDVYVLKPGADYNNLAKSYVIFICNFDLFNQERCIYTFENRCLDNLELPLGDETSKIFINTKGQISGVSRKLRELINYLDHEEISGQYSKQLDDAVKHIKASEERRRDYVVTMIKEMELREEGREEGIKEGREEGREEGILGSVEFLRDFQQDDQTIIMLIRDKYQLTQKQAEGFVFRQA